VLKLKVVWFFCSHPVFFLEIDPRLLTPDQPIFGHSAKVVLQHGQEEKWCCKIHTDQKLLFGCNLGWKPTLTFGFFFKAKAVEKANQNRSSLRLTAVMNCTGNATKIELKKWCSHVRYMIL
jgi:hypothetical protein